MVSTFAQHASLAVGLCLLVASCHEQAPPPPPAVVSAKPTASAVSLEPAPTEVPLHAGPGSPSSPRAEHEARVLSVLRGLAQSERLPEIATDDGGAPDPRLREKLAPRKTTIVQPSPRPHPKPVPEDPLLPSAPHPKPLPDF